jgi:hypothetical protein
MLAVPSGWSEQATSRERAPGQALSLAFRIGHDMIRIAAGHRGAGREERLQCGCDLRGRARPVAWPGSEMRLTLGSSFIAGTAVTGSCWTKDPGQECRRPLLVTAGDDGAVQLRSPSDCARRPGQRTILWPVRESRVPAGVLVYLKLSGSWVGP